ncbi:MAG: DUF3656 domain-containing protein, partial [Clostridia bacterium]|nr:DUF3656 domain-containing protein [Clostridia bacterium]
ATGNPVTGETLAKNLNKLGGTPFRWAEGQPETEIGENLWYPVSAVNAIRRQAAEALETCLHPAIIVRDGEAYTHTAVTPTAYPGSASPAIAVLTGREQWCSQMENAFETTYIPAAEYIKWAGEGSVPSSVGADLPPLAFDGMDAMVKALQETGCTHVRFHSPGQLYLLRETEMHTCGSFRLNVWNSDALHWWYAQGADRVTLSPEVTLGGLRTLARTGMPGGAIVYGHIPLMLTERCVLQEKPRREQSGRKTILPCGGLGGRNPIIGTCGGTGENPCRCTGTLTDRLGSRFPVIAKDGVSVICNGQPLWMADKMENLPQLTHREFLFTIETAEEIRRVIRDTAAGAPRAGKRLK